MGAPRSVEIFPCQLVGYWELKGAERLVLTLRFDPTNVTLAALLLPALAKSPFRGAAHHVPSSGVVALRAGNDRRIVACGFGSRCGFAI